jgi:hypothetical protein
MKKRRYKGRISHIHQGRYDTEKELSTLRDNALRVNNVEILDAVNQRLKKMYPKVYQREVGPLFDRIRDPKFQCYCNNPRSLFDVCKDINNHTVPDDALSCDACWAEDLSTTWGYYGYTKKMISKHTWKNLCEDRGYDKYVS